ncbi:MAG: hypothetical protein IKQ10_06375, partial [Oscillospiraceae bacterium]|nr:hypothetical protein [Oscillospiraceae bacterium]
MKRWLCLLLTVLMLASMFPTAYAMEDTQDEEYLETEELIGEEPADEEPEPLIEEEEEEDLAPQLEDEEEEPAAEEPA